MRERRESGSQDPQRRRRRGRSYLLNNVWKGRNARLPMGA